MNENFCTLLNMLFQSNLIEESYSEPPVHIGVATGDIYQGVVGSYTRKEVVSIGEAFERAQLLM